MTATTFNRRTFLKIMGSTTATGFAIGVTSLSAGCDGELQTGTKAGNWRAWINIERDNSVTVYCPRMEMGQGVLTGLGMLVAEELDADWNSITVRHAPLDDEFGSQLTENSESVRVYWPIMRKLGAGARTQLIRAAAQAWKVEPSTCTASLGLVSHPASGRQASYGELADAAARLPLSAQIELKEAMNFRLLTRSAPRIDIPSMLDGSLKYTADLSFPGLLSATILHSPMLGGRVASIDNRAALAVPGVKTTVDLGFAVAVVAENFWSAEQGRRQLKVDWAKPVHAAMDEGAMRIMLKAACLQPAAAFINLGNSASLLSSAESLLTQEYSVRYEAHATMEPMTCIADVRANSCEVWAPTQSPWAAYGVARDHGLSPFFRFCERLSRKLTGKANGLVKVHAIPMGGGFGRRLNQDFVREAVLVSKAVQAPVKLLWTREQDMANDFYRPASQHRIQAALDSQGNIAAWRHRIAGSGILDHGVDFPYDCANVRVELSYHEIGVPTGSLRSTAHTPNAFARECFMDELAVRAGRDPVEYRLSQLSKNPRLKRVLEIAAEKAGWTTPLPAGRSKGVALHPSKDSFVAQIAEISRAAEGAIRVHRVICVADCGMVFNPDTVKAQMQGAIVFGLTSALKTAISVRNGGIEQSNFHDFSLLRMNEAPNIEIYLVESADAPGGVGESGVPPIAPAIGNAIFALTGNRPRELPMLSPALTT